MRRVTRPQPPNANDPRYSGNVLAFMRDTSDWMRRIKGLLEDASRVNDSPMGQQFQLGSFTTNTTLNGTSTLGDGANFVCSLAQAMTVNWMAIGY